MKKIFIILCCITVLLMCLTVPCFAAEAEDISEPAQTVETVTPEHTIFTRAWEFVKRYKDAMLTLVGDIGLVGLAIYMRLRNGKGTKEINDMLVKIEQETGLSLSNQGNVVDVINRLIDSYNTQAAEYSRLRESYEKYGTTEIDRNTVIGALAAQVATVLDILSTVYVNNKNLPQGVKDLVNIKYANCLKALDNSEQLSHIVKAVREVLSPVEEKEASQPEEETENVEIPED